MIGYWRVAIPQAHWSSDPHFRRHLKKNWNDLHGDRRQELVFIGMDMDEAAIRAKLDACLVTGKPGMDKTAWSKLLDPFPDWRRANQQCNG
ncbi:GTP-binding protein [Bradyrhizobium manausense]|uniref:GTP-binding protein n=1 Tax=Bradyrhizobium manausense TaxID=989370 RepID=UPI0032DF4A49